MSTHPVTDTAVIDKVISPATGDTPACAMVCPTCLQRQRNPSSAGLSSNRKTWEVRPTPPVHLAHRARSHQPSQPVFAKSP